jgi:hypothetical protein
VWLIAKDCQLRFQLPACIHYDSSCYKQIVLSYRRDLGEMPELAEGARLEIVCA